MKVGFEVSKDAHPYGKRIADENHVVSWIDGKRLGRGINQGGKNTAKQNGAAVHGKIVSRPTNQGKEAKRAGNILYRSPICCRNEPHGVLFSGSLGGLSIGKLNWWEMVHAAPPSLFVISPNPNGSEWRSLCGRQNFDCFTACQKAPNRSA